MLNKKDFLGMIAVRFLKRFNDICAVDISKENSFRLKLDSGRSTFIIVILTVYIVIMLKE